MILYLIQPLILIRLLWLSKKIPDYRKRWLERYGFVKGKVKPGGIMIHSVSVGEVLSVIPLVRILHQRYPLTPITITTITPTGSQQVQSILGNDVYHVYLPYDLPGAINRFLRLVSPKLVIIMETELWPNLIKTLHQSSIPVIIANARLSACSVVRYKRFNNFISDIMKCITFVAAQTKEDGDRFLKIGLSKNQLKIIGNLKFDVNITPELSEKVFTLRRKWTFQRPVWIAASTHKGEEHLLLQAHHHLLKKFPNLLLILVPRHPERFSVVQKIIKKYGFNYIKISNGKNPSDTTQIVMGDTMGELKLLYSIADLAFIGGSLVEKGGHNPLEAAIYAIPILMGPHTLNFSEICNKLEKAGGLITVTFISSLINVISILLTNKNYRLSCGIRAFEVLRQNQGALQCLLNLIEPFLLQKS